jgi:hypothetical protein
LSFVKDDGRDLPDVAAIFPDPAVGGQTTGSGGVENGHARPGVLIAVRLADALFSQSPPSAMVEPKALSAIL